MSNTAEKFYDDQRKKGLTDKITTNPEPDYSLPFYQEIFDLMDGFAKLKISKLELTQVPVGDDTPLSRCLKRISELEKENQELRNSREIGANLYAKQTVLVSELEKEIQELKRELARYEIHHLKRKQAMTDKEKLKQANVLIESLYYKVYNQCSFINGDFKMYPDTSAQHQIVDYFKATNQRTKLKRPTVKGSTMLAC